MLLHSPSTTSKVRSTKCSDEPTVQTLRQICGIFLSSTSNLCWAERNPASVTASSWSIQAHAATWALIPRCHVPNPPTGEEDATMALTIWAKSPMNMWNHKLTKTECWNKMIWTRTCTDAIVYHTQRKQHTFIQHSVNMFIVIINRNKIAEVKWTRITYLMKNSFCNQLRRCNVPPNHRLARS